MLALLHQHPRAKNHAHPSARPQATRTRSNQPLSAPGATMIIQNIGYPGNGKTSQTTREIVQRIVDNPPPQPEYPPQHIDHQPTKNQSKIQE